MKRQKESIATTAPHKTKTKDKAPAPERGAAGGKTRQKTKPETKDKAPAPERGAAGAAGGKTSVITKVALDRENFPVGAPQGCRPPNLRLSYLKTGSGQVLDGVKIRSKRF